MAVAWNPAPGWTFNQPPPKLSISRTRTFIWTPLELSFGRSTSAPRLGEALASRIVSGGYPAALARSAGHRRAAWYRDYAESIVQRDVRDLMRVSSLEALQRLLELAAGQTSRLVNVAELAAPFQLSRPTIAEYVGLLERLFLIERLQPWHVNRLSRLIKTPKLHFSDTGLAAALLGVDDRALWQDRPLLGQLAETFVHAELRRQASASPEPFQFHHMRDKDGVEVDIVVERGRNAMAGIEVTASATPRAADFAGLIKLRAVMGSRFKAGVLLHDGERCLSFGDRLQAVPFRLLWAEK